MEKFKCDICNRGFSSADALKMHTAAKHQQKQEKQIPKRKPFKIRSWAILAIVIIGILGAFFYFSSNAKAMPPTDMKNHIEVNPTAHVLKTPMEIGVQKHMLEHADGITNGRGGVIINYNCDEYDCEPDLIAKLEQFGNNYSNVYVAPFENMGAKIALTKLGRLQVLDEYNEEAIKSFIG